MWKGRENKERGREEKKRKGKGELKVNEQPALERKAELHLKKSFVIRILVRAT